MAQDMNADAQPSAMRRKAGAGRPPPEIGQLTPAKILRAAVAQAAQDVVGMVAVAGNVEEARTTRDAFSETVEETALIALLEGPENRYGVLVLDPQALAALIEAQTTGRVVPRPADPRPPTRTDAIMCADFIDRLLEITEAELGAARLDVAPALSGYRFAMALTDTRAIGMTLDDVHFRHFKIPVDFSQGAKTGAIDLLLPLEAARSGARSAGDGEDFSEALRAQVMEAEAALEATLLRREMTLAEIAELAVGDVLTLPRDALSRVAIEDLAGRRVAYARLGQMNGHRALRLTSEPDASAGSLADPSQPAALFSSGGSVMVEDLPEPKPALDGLGDLAGLGAVDGEEKQDFDAASLGDLADLGGDGGSTTELADLPQTDATSELPPLPGVDAGDDELVSSMA